MNRKRAYLKVVKEAASRHVLQCQQKLACAGAAVHAPELDDVRMLQIGQASRFSGQVFVRAGLDSKGFAAVLRRA